MVKKTKQCRVCEGKKFTEVIDFGETPLVNSLIEKEDLDKEEPTFPLSVTHCEECGLVQTESPIDSHKIYKDQDYLYFSSDMPGLSGYFFEYAVDVRTRFLKDPDAFVIEIGSNDGVMLEHFAKWGHPVLGIDPATNVAIRALARGIPTLPLFFDERLAKTVAKELRKADLIYGNNCIAHIDDLDSVLRGVDALLQDSGVFVVECNWWGGMVENLNYSLIYHDHFSYFSLKDWHNIAAKHNLEVFDAEVTPAQGGSLRVFLARPNRQKKTDASIEVARQESDMNLSLAQTAKKFGKDVTEKAKKLGEQVKALKAEGKTIAGYGAAAKGFSILHLANITDELDYFVDDSPAKQGKYTPVNHIPVISREEAEKKLPDYFFITAPNYADIIMKKEEGFAKKGGKFLLEDGTVK